MTFVTCRAFACSSPDLGRRQRHVTLVEFAQPAALIREADRPSQFAIVGNGPPGTFVLLQGLRISLPTDQIVSITDVDGRVCVGFGGMAFVGEEDGRLRFDRVREMRPIAQLSPDRSHRMFLDIAWVAAVHEDGVLRWSPTR